MDKPRDVERWADAVLERHRTAPPGSSTEDETVIEYMQRRAEHYGRHQRRFANVEAVLMLVGTVLLCVFGIAFYSSF